MENCSIKQEQLEWLKDLFAILRREVRWEGRATIIKVHDELGIRPRPIEYNDVKAMKDRAEDRR